MSEYVPDEVFEELSHSLGQFIGNTLVIDRTLTDIRAVIQKALDRHHVNIPADIAFEIVDLGNSVAIKVRR